MILLDTHVWIWWINNPDYLPDKVQHIIHQHKSQNSIAVSFFSIWEFCMLVQKQRLHLSEDVKDWIARTEKLPYVTFVPISRDILIQSVYLDDYPHKDPADRIILATAMNLNAALITKDHRLQDYQHVETIW